MANRRKTLPTAAANVPPSMRPLLAAMTEILETGEGVRGDKLDRKLTLRDMLDGGLARFRIPGNPESGLTPSEGPKDMSSPPGPKGFYAIGAFYGTVTLGWDSPYDMYRNHANTNIYRSLVDNFANAEIIGKDTGMAYTDKIRNDVVNSTDSVGYFYWITFSSASGIEGPPNSLNGTYAKPIQDIKYIIEELSKNFADRPATIGAPGETVIINAERFAVKVGEGSEAVYPLIIDEVNGVPTVVMNTVLIREASIQEGQLGPITIGKLFDSEGNPITAINGLLRADMIDVDNLRVVDANISGTIKSTALDAAGRPRWILDKNGGLSLNGAGSGGSMNIQDNVIKVYDGAGRLRVQIGDLNA